ncbi:MAG: hypothetical protein IJ150_08525 [Bacteroidales bacterium]|nr:hypothetical protein [Bacteroidales bacterium]
MKNTSVFCSVVGIMLLIIGFNGIMAHKYSNNIQEIKGAKIVDYHNVDKYFQNEKKLCIIGKIKSDDAFFMSDDKTKKVVFGEIKLSIVWPDGSKKMLINQSKKSQLLKFYDTKSQNEFCIIPQNFETQVDTSFTINKIKTNIFGNYMKIEYGEYSFLVSGLLTKGKPKIQYMRKTIDENQKVAMILSKSANRNSQNDYSFDVQNIIPFEKAVKEEHSDIKSLKIYIIMLCLGVAMFFVPDKLLKKL